MARDATARLYDAQEVVLEKLMEKERYDQGTITFRARKGKLIDLDKLHESIWATRLSEGTRSGLVSLEVTVAGRVAVKEDASVVIEVGGSDARFVLLRDPADGHKEAFDRLRAALDAGRSVVRVTGRLEGWEGLWPSFLSKPPPKPRRILVASFREEGIGESAKRSGEEDR